MSRYGRESKHAFSSKGHPELSPVAWAPGKWNASKQKEKNWKQRVEVYVVNAVYF